MQADVYSRAAGIRLLVLDVDGVLTDGRLYFTARGEEMKCFHVRDGSGIVQLRRAGIEVAVISGRNSEAVNVRARELGIEHVHQGVDKKIDTLTALLGRLRLDARALACMGDDVPDIEMLRAAHLAIAVADAHTDAKSCAHYVTTRPGGLGAVREACDLILSAREVSK